MILLIDNYDSFTYNLYQYLEELGQEVIVKRNNETTLEEIERMDLEAIVISPGPGKPEDAGITIPVVHQFYNKLPILGICLGHQAIGVAFGAKITPSKEIKHGKTSLIRHKGVGLFQYLPQPLEVMRYHSLVIDPYTLPPFIERVAASMDDGELMAVKHQKYPVYGLQFHPESIGTLEGKKILNQFLQTLNQTRQLASK